MFRLHENTKTRICRGAFLALCVAPLCAVVAWSVLVNTAWYRRSHERAIAARLGWQVRLQAVSTPRPGTLLYRGLDLFDHDNGQLLARLPFVEIESEGAATVVRSPYPAVVNGTRLDACWELVERLMLHSSGAGNVCIEAGNVTLHLADGDQSFTEIVGQLDGDPLHAQAMLSFRRAIAGNRPAEPSQLRVTRHAGATSSVQELQLHTGGTPLPAVLFTSLWPGAERLGKTCHFRGSLRATEQAGQWQAEIAGHLSDVDLDLLISRQFPHKLTGLAHVRLKRAKLAGGRLESAAGNVTAGPGVISRSLVQSAETHLHVQAALEAVHGPGNLIDYHLFAASFEVNPRGMALRGEVAGGRGALLVDKKRILAIEPPVVSQPVVALVRTLVPHSDVQVPATRETVDLTGSLPVPSLVPEPGDEQPLPTARPLTVRARPVGNPLR
jgi:hypothetical protein